MSTASQKENSGLRVNYYLAQVDHPQREEQPAYQAECEDLIDALGLTFDEANIFKEIWRTANERTHGVGKEGNDPYRAAQKYVHYSTRILRKQLLLRKAERDKTASARAAVDALAGHEPAEKVWIVWPGFRGETRAFDAQALDTWVEIVRRDGVHATGSLGAFDWHHYGADHDIVKYRMTR